MTTFKQILEGKGETLVPMLHLSQMLTFIEGGGVEFYLLSDLDDARKRFIDDIVAQNQLDLKTTQMASTMMLEGKLLLWLRPTGRTYEIRFFPKEQYETFYDADGVLESVEIIYSYKKRSKAGIGAIAQSNFSREQLSWIKIRLTDTTYERWDSEGTKPNFNSSDFMQVPSATAENSLGFIPCREIQNINYRGQTGKSEFEELQGQIESHNSQCEAVRNNLLAIANNPFITSLEEEQIFEVVSETGHRDSVAYSQGYRTAEQIVSEQPFNSDRQGKRLKQVIGGFDPASGDFLQQVQVSPLPPNQLIYVDDKERKLRLALGGTPEKGLETATETRIAYGAAITTANKKQKALYSYGLCEILSMAILAEENLFLASQGAIGLPTAPLGLDRKVQWRIQPAFPPSDSAELNRSIIGRNKARVGVNQLECARANFPDKSDQEIKQMLAGGVPVEYLEMLCQTAQMLQNIYDPETGLPMTAIIPISSYLQNALQYAGQPGATYLDTGTSGATRKLEQRSFDAALKLAQRIFNPGRVGELGKGASEPNVTDAEQQLPAEHSTVSDNNPGFFERNFPTFNSAATAAINGVSNLVRPSDR
jgi:hypothetical protein